MPEQQDVLLSKQLARLAIEPGLVLIHQNLVNQYQNLTAALVLQDHDPVKQGQARMLHHLLTDIARAVEAQQQANPAGVPPNPYQDVPGFGT